MLRILAAIALGTTLLAADSVQAAQRPGEREWILQHYGRTVIGDVVATPDGRIVVAGNNIPYHGDWTWVHAYLPSGVFDTTFGAGGMVDFPGDSRVVKAASAQPDGRIVVAEQDLIRRFTRDGRPDASFGGGSIAAGSSDAFIHDIAVQDDGRLVVAWVRYPADRPVTIQLRRYLDDGSPDPSFGSNGLTEFVTSDIDTHAALALQPDGGLILTAGVASLPLIARLTPGGQADGSFGGGEFAPVQLGRRAWSDGVSGSAPPALVLPDGRIRVGLSFARSRDGDRSMAVAGLTRNGRPELTFGDRGLALGPLTHLRGKYAEFASGEAVSTMVRDPRGGILMAGNRSSGEEYPHNLHSAVRRFRPDGSLDRSFGDRGVIRGRRLGSGYDSLTIAMAFLGDNRLLIADSIVEAKYRMSVMTTLRSLYAGYDDDPPRISIAGRCHAIRVRISDISRLARVVVRAPARVLYRTAHKAFRLALPRGTKGVSVKATDLAKNVSTRTARLPRC